MELPTRTAKILSVFSREDLIDLDDRQIEIAIELFNKYNYIFAKDGYDLGCASNTQHVLYVGDHPPILFKTTLPVSKRGISYF